MKIKTSELTGSALDWAAAQAIGTKPVYNWRAFGVKHYGAWETAPAVGSAVMLQPYSSDWAQGGPIIEREEIGSFHYIHGFHGPTWSASIGSGGFQQDGPTPLIAAMRCYVASKLGDTVNIPEELT